jgi:hypothetical protein
MFGRDSRTLSKLFESIANSPEGHERTLSKAKVIQSVTQKKFIVGLKY